jgi:hypothetical protein
MAQLKAKTHVDLLLEQKREICVYADKNPNTKQIHLIIHFENKFNRKISKSTMSKILKDKEKYTMEDHKNEFRMMYIYFDIAIFIR